MILGNNLIQWALYLILFTPLLVFTGFSHPFTTTKALAFQVLVDFVLCVAAVLILTGARRQDSVNHENVTLRRILLPFMVLVYLGYSLAAALFSIDPGRSLWDSIEQQNGLVLQLHFAAWMCVLVWFYRGRKEIEKAVDPRRKSDKHRSKQGAGEVYPLSRYLELSLWVSAGVAISAIYQWLEQRFHIFGLLPASLLKVFGGRVGGVFGNPMLLGPYLLFHFFYGLYLLTRPFHAMKSETGAGGDSRSSKGLAAPGLRSPKTVFILPVLFLIVFSILLGQTRGVMLGLAAGSVVAAILLALSRSVARPIRLAMGIALVLMVIGSTLFLGFRDAGFVQRIPALKRVAGTSTTDPTLIVRLIVWKSAIKAFRSNPLLGCGVNNAYYALNRFYDPVLASYDRSFSVGYDKVHNAYLEVLAERGMVGALLYLVMLGAAVTSLRSMRDRYLAFFLSAAFVSYLASNIFAFDGFGALFGLFLFLTPLALSDLQIRAGGFESKEMWFCKERFRNATQKAATACLLVVAGWSLLLNLQMGIASQGYQSARNAFGYDPNLGMSYYEDAFRTFSPYRTREKLYCLKLAVENLINGNIGADPLGCLRRVERYATDISQAYPMDPMIFMTLADAYSHLGYNINEKILPKRAAFEKAEMFGSRALALSPNHQEAAMILGRTYLYLNQPARAVDLNRRMVDAAPSLPVRRWLLGLSLFENKQAAEAGLEIGKALQMGFRPDEGPQKNRAIEILGEKEFLELTATR
jgi:hypothetical protein